MKSVMVLVTIFSIGGDFDQVTCWPIWVAFYFKWDKWIERVESCPQSI